MLVIIIPVITYYVPFITELFLFFYGRDCALFISEDIQVELYAYFNSNPRYLDDLLNID